MHKMDRFNTARAILKAKGVLLSHEEDEDIDFYGIIAEHFKPEKVTESECRAELAKFILKHKFQFQIFLPASSNWTSDALKDLTQDVRSKGRRPPSPREIYATAELLQRDVHLIQFSGNTQSDTDKFSVAVFSPVFKAKLSSKGDENMGNDENNTPLLLLLVRNPDGYLQFSEITGDVQSVDDALSLPRATHKLCSVTRYRNSFSTLFQQRHFRLEEGGGHDFYKTLSIVFYGDETYRDRVKEMICSFESDQDHVDMVVSFLDSTNETNNSKVAKQHVVNLRSETVLPKDPEFFAAASIFNVPIFLDKNGASEYWNLYMPLTGAYGNTFESSIILTRLNSSKYRIVVNNPGQCLCRQELPFVKGKLGTFKDRIYDEIMDRLGRVDKIYRDSLY